MAVRTLQWQDDALVLLDQTLLPTRVEYLACRDVETVARAIETLQVRGAPAIGVAAAYGVVLATQPARSESSASFDEGVESAIARLARTRPTAVNLFWALERMRGEARRRDGEDNASVHRRLLQAANRLWEEDRQVCRALGRNGAALLVDGCRVITHCNAGGLATADYGTALGVIYAAQEAGKRVAVFADETRPLLQGARLTAWELQQNGVDVTLICDNMAAAVMRRQHIDCAIVGADRIAANGDVANKIGTYGLAILAREHRVPFYVAAPTSTLDLSLPSGDAIPIEERGADEITCGFGRRTAPEGVKTYNPAFDVTPAHLVSAIVSERGIARPPYGPVLRQWVAQNGFPDAAPTCP